MLRLTVLLPFVLPFCLVSVVAAEKPPLDTINARLVSYYAKASNYRRVKRDVLKWHKTTRNGCVAFASTALRHINYDVPLLGKRDGWGVSRITFAFSDFLKEAGWTTLTNSEDLAPGDLAFTSGYPDHVFVFQSWSNRHRQIARVLDNKGYLSRREMSPRVGSKISAFAYALRAPSNEKRDLR